MVTATIVTDPPDDGAPRACRARVLGARLDGRDRQRADQAALDAAADAIEPRYRCGCLIVVVDAYGHRLGCAAGEWRPGRDAAIAVTGWVDGPR